MIWIPHNSNHLFVVPKAMLHQTLSKINMTAVLFGHSVVIAAYSHIWMWTTSSSSLSSSCPKSLSTHKISLRGIQPECYIFWWVGSRGLSTSCHRLLSPDLNFVTWMTQKVNQKFFHVPLAFHTEYFIIVFSQLSEPFGHSKLTNMAPKNNCSWQRWMIL